MERILIKNMVCDRCILVVRQELNQLGFLVEEVRLGEVTLGKKPTENQMEQLTAKLNSLGFEIIGDKKGRIIEQIKNIILQQVQQTDSDQRYNLSDLLKERLNHDYNSLSNLFSEVEGTTIEKYFIAQKIEKVKELLVYDELTLNEIAYKLNYSSVAYLSNQFKKVTGLTPSHFKKIGSAKRKPLDKV